MAKASNPEKSHRSEGAAARSPDLATDLTAGLQADYRRRPLVRQSGGVGDRGRAARHGIRWRVGLPLRRFVQDSRTVERRQAPGKDRTSQHGDSVPGPKIRVAFIGTGAVTAYHHLPGLRLDPRAELVAICDTDPELLEQAQGRVERRASRRPIPRSCVAGMPSTPW